MSKINSYLSHYLPSITLNNPSTTCHMKLMHFVIFELGFLNVSQIHYVNSCKKKKTYTWNL